MLAYYFKFILDVNLIKINLKKIIKIESLSRYEHILGMEFWIPEECLKILAKKMGPF
jgi:hypothetical protein